MKIAAIILALLFGCPQGLEAFEGADPGVKARAEGGDAEAQHRLGWAYFSGSYLPSGDGRYDPQNRVEGVRWIRKAAEQGHAEALYSLGFAYEHGMGVPQSFTEAAKWHRISAEQGNAAAQARMGYLHLRGDVGLLIDHAESVKWFRTAAEQGHAGSQLFLGRAYASGKGIPLDSVRAHAWLSLSVVNSDERAARLVQEDRDDIARLMTNEQLAEAQKLAVEYFEKYSVK